MTNPTPHGQVPEALRLAHIFDSPLPPEWPDMVAAAAELRRQHDRIAELEAQIEALSGVQALSAAPAEVLGWLYEDELHEHYPYDAMFPHSKVDTVRMFPVFGPKAASPTPPAEQPIGELVVTKTRDGQIVSVTRQDDEGRILSVIATSDSAEQTFITPETGNSASAQGAAITSESGAVYAELPAPTASIGIDDTWHEAAMHDFADRTHALRMQQAAHKAEPTWPSESLVWEALQAYLKHDTNMEGMRAALIVGATPPAEQQATKETSGGFHVWRDISTAPKDGSRFVATGHNYGLYSEVRHTCVAQWFRGCWMEASDWNETSELKYLTHWMPLPSPPDDVAAPAEQQAAPKAAPAWEHHARKLTQWLHCMSHNDSYFGEPAGLVKQVTGELNRLIGAAPQQEAQEPVAIKAMGYGGSTGINDYLMSDGTIKAMRPNEVVWAAPQPAPALSDDVEQKTWALLDELEKLRSANREDEDWATLNVRDSELRAAIAAQGGKDATMG